MALAHDLAKVNAPVSLEGESVLVAGGTRGIGAGVALRFAQAGASVLIVGRSQQAGSQVLEQLKAATSERNGRAQHSFISADLSEPKEVQNVVDLVASQAPGRGVDHVVLTQGGPPVKALDFTTSTGLDRGFSVQDLSRFGFAHLLSQRGLVQRSITCVLAPGQGSKSPLDSEDLDFHKAANAGRVYRGILGTPTRGARDSSVIDAFTQTLAERHPSLRVSHLFPGFVSTNALVASGLPGAWILAKIAPYVAQSAGPGGYAEIPFWVAANPAPLPSGEDPRKTGAANLFNEKLVPVPISPNVASSEQRAPILAALSKWFPPSS